MSFREAGEESTESAKRLQGKRQQEDKAAKHQCQLQDIGSYNGRETANCDVDNGEECHQKSREHEGGITADDKLDNKSQHQNVGRRADQNKNWKGTDSRSEEHTSELQSRGHLVCR